MHYYHIFLLFGNWYYFFCLSPVTDHKYFDRKERFCFGVEKTCIGIQCLFFIFLGEILKYMGHMLNKWIACVFLFGRDVQSQSTSNASEIILINRTGQWIFFLYSAWVWIFVPSHAFPAADACISLFSTLGALDLPSSSLFLTWCSSSMAGSVVPFFFFPVAAISAAAASGNVDVCFSDQGFWLHFFVGWIFCYFFPFLGLVGLFLPRLLSRAFCIWRHFWRPPAHATSCSIFFPILGPTYRS